jgi:hypothetical protein
LRKTLHGDDEVMVTWFDSDDKAQTAECPPAALKVYADETPEMSDEDE